MLAKHLDNEEVNQLPAVLEEPAMASVLKVYGLFLCCLVRVLVLFFFFIGCLFGVFLFGFVGFFSFVIHPPPFFFFFWYKYSLHCFFWLSKCSFPIDMITYLPFRGILYTECILFSRNIHGIKFYMLGVSAGISLGFVEPPGGSTYKRSFKPWRDQSRSISQRSS